MDPKPVGKNKKLKNGAPKWNGPAYRQIQCEAKSYLRTMDRWRVQRELFTGAAEAMANPTYLSGGMFDIEYVDPRYAECFSEL